MPPPYNSREYWDERFRREASFDWLLSTSDTLSIISNQLDCHGGGKEAEILHIGCGNSELSHSLPQLVGPDGKVTNVDYSETVIEAAKAKADYGRRYRQTEWVAADLLSATDIKRSLLHRTGSRRHETDGYDLIVDKSTSDSIACVEDQAVALPYPIRETHWNAKSTSAPLPLNSESRTTAIHPLRMLALHLALLASRPGSMWLAFSYSEERFGFLEVNNQLDNEALDARLSDPRRLWRLERKLSIERFDDADPIAENERGSGRTVHRPPELCWVYVLVRTDVGVEWT